MNNFKTLFIIELHLKLDEIEYLDIFRTITWAKIGTEVINRHD
ncbi:hypothetical protein M233_10425 [Xylella fastidiosa subsp. multiplex Griffin-1]|nr:hypothetical protein M233_10425 [Xylella fastidiosa subsp. multiplex Griffin-1]